MEQRTFTHPSVQTDPTASGSRGRWPEVWPPGVGGGTAQEAHSPAALSPSRTPRCSTGVSYSNGLSPHTLRPRPAFFSPHPCQSGPAVTLPHPKLASSPASFWGAGVEVCFSWPGWRLRGAGTVAYFSLGLSTRAYVWQCGCQELHDPDRAGWVPGNQIFYFLLLLVFIMLTSF